MQSTFWRIRHSLCTGEICYSFDTIQEARVALNLLRTWKKGTPVKNERHIAHKVERFYLYKGNEEKLHPWYHENSNLQTLYSQAIS